MRAFGSPIRDHVDWRVHCTELCGANTEVASGFCIRRTAHGRGGGFPGICLHLAPIDSNSQNDLGTQGRITRKLLLRVRMSMCGAQIESEQQEGVFDDYRTVAGRFRRIALSVSRGETPATLRYVAPGSKDSDHVTHWKRGSLRAQ